MTEWPPRQSDSLDKIANAFRRRLGHQIRESTRLTYQDYNYRSPRGRRPSVGRALLFEAVAARITQGERVNEKLLLEEQARLVAQTDDPLIKDELKQSVNASARNNFHNRFREIPLDASRCCEALCDGAFEAAAEIYTKLTPTQFKKMTGILTGISQHD